MRALMAWIAGLSFGAGLLISGMTDPSKVLGFLDVTGEWDPSLAFVMIAAIPIAALGFRGIATGQRTPIGETVDLPEARHIDRRLIAGAILFGIGWGVAGICPGPAIVATASSFPNSDTFLWFTGSMCLAMLIFNLTHRPSASVTTVAAAAHNKTSGTST